MLKVSLHTRIPAEGGLAKSELEVGLEGGTGLPLGCAPLYKEKGRSQQDTLQHCIPALKSSGFSSSTTVTLKLA